MKSKRMQWIAILLIFSPQTLIGYGSEQDSFTPNQIKWHDELIATIKKSKTWTAEKAFLELGGMVAIGSEPRVNELQSDIFVQAQAAMLARSGYADYFAKRIETARAEAIVENARRGGEEWQSYDFERKNAFRILANLPSLETVRVLASFLNDVRDFTTPEQRALNPYYHVYGTNAQGAAAGLSRLIVDFRRQGHEDDPNFYLPPEVWQVWAEQVKAGTRTFRLKGDPQDYDFNGPASKETLQRIERSRSREEAETVRRPSSAASDEKAPQPTGGKSPSRLVFFAACIVLAAAVWWLIKKRRALG